MAVSIALVAGGAAEAQFDKPRKIPGTCVLEVRDRLIQAGPCRFTADTKQLTIYPPQRLVPFAIVNAEPDDSSLGEGWWSGLDEYSTHAHDPLGEMRRFGACWIGPKAKVCAWGTAR